jgi:hypothetical protein
MATSDIGGQRMGQLFFKHSLNPSVRKAMQTGTYYVITVGKSYLRFADKAKYWWVGNDTSPVIVGRQIAFAHKFKTEADAIEIRDLIRQHRTEAEKKKKPINVLKVTIEEIP